MISAVIKYSDGSVNVHSSDTKYVGKIFTPGTYKTWTVDGNLKIQVVEIPELHNPYRSRENELLIKTVHGFFNDEARERVEKLGFVHKLGILLYGKQGCGKTSILNFVAQRLVEQAGAVVFYCDSNNTLSTATHLAHSIREIQNHPIVFVADEFEQYCRESEAELKNLLDGKDSIPNSLFLAATNYIDKVPDTLKKRPSRFKIVREVFGITDKRAMKAILNNISSRIDPALFNIDEIDTIVKELKTATMDELKHICLDRVTNTFIPDTMKKASTIGFNKKEDEEDDVVTWGEDSLKGLFNWEEPSLPVLKLITGNKKLKSADTNI